MLCIQTKTWNKILFPEKFVYLHLYFDVEDWGNAFEYYEPKFWIFDPLFHPFIGKVVYTDAEEQKGVVKVCRSNLSWDCEKLVKLHRKYRRINKRFKASCFKTVPSSPFRDFWWCVMHIWSCQNVWQGFSNHPKYFFSCFCHILEQKS